MIVRHTDNPNPMPSSLLVKKGSNTFSSFPFGDAGTGIANGDHHEALLAHVRFGTSGHGLLSAYSAIASQAFLTG